MKVPTIGSHIEIYPYEGNKINLYNKASGKTYLIGEKEAKVLMLLDGNHSLNEIEKECAVYTVEEIEKLINAFSDIGLFERTRNKNNIFKLKKRLFNPNTFFHKNGPLTKFLFNLIMVGCPVMLIIGIVFNVFMFNRNIDNVVSIPMIINEYMNFGISDFIVIYIGFIACLMIHELSHTVAARYYGVNVPEIGIMLYFFIPCAYTNISGINLLKSKKERLLVLAAGNLSNLGMLGILYLAFSIVDAHTAALFIGLIILNIGTVFMNGLIFLKFDGYYMLEVILEETKLREKAIQHIKQCSTMLMNKDKSAWNGFREDMRNNDSKYLMHLTYLAFSLLSLTYIPFTIINAIISVISLI